MKIIENSEQFPSCISCIIAQYAARYSIKCCRCKMKCILCTDDEINKDYGTVYYDTTSNINDINSINININSNTNINVNRHVGIDYGKCYCKLCWDEKSVPILHDVTSKPSGPKYYGSNTSNAYTSSNNYNNYHSYSYGYSRNDYRKSYSTNSNNNNNNTINKNSKRRDSITQLRKDYRYDDWIYWCHLCRCEISGTVNVSTHEEGKKHKRNRHRYV